MPVISARQLTKSYGPQTLFEGISLTIGREDRVGLLGINGTGKSTLLRVLVGAETLDSGTIERRRDSSLLYLSQEPKLDPNLTPRQIVESGLGEWKRAMDRYAELGHAIAASSAPGALLEEQACLLDRIEHLGGWDQGHRVDDMLGKLSVLSPDSPVGPMSGGEQRRVALAHLLVARPSLAVLDEPTNHLDADTIDWLEDYLTNSYQGAVLVVTHDRYFLDAVCSRIFELDRGQLFEYQGNYSSYLEQKSERLAHEERTEQNRANLLRRERAWLQRGAKARSTKQKARIQRAEELIANEPDRAPGTVQFNAFELDAKKGGKHLLTFDGVSLSLGGRKLIDTLTLHLTSGERLGILGPNGAGKTSLLKLLTGELKPDSGGVRLAAQTRVALFDQARAGLRDDWSIFDNVAERAGAEREGAGVVQFGDRTFELRTYLEHFLFEGSKQRQPVGALSGGERARVALAKMLKTSANLLLLDEPTNDLDVSTLSALEELLETFSGSALIVSHDRGFLDRVVSSLLVFEGDGRVVHYPGNYSTYRSLRAAADQERQAAVKATAATPAKASVAASGTATPAAAVSVKPLSNAEKKELDGLMDRVTAAEERVYALQAELADPNFYATRGSEAASKQRELELANQQVVNLMQRWEELEARKSLKR